jgi:excisionase family DNA binding protein
MSFRKIAAALPPVTPSSSAAPPANSAEANPNRAARRAAASNGRAGPPVTPPDISPGESARRERQRAHSIAETGKQLGLCRASVYKLITDGRLRPIRVGARVLIPDRQIAALLGE